MVKKIRNDAIFKKPEIEKKKRLKKDLKTFTEKKNKEYKIFYKFLLTSIILIFAFFHLPNTVKYIDDNFVKKRTVINVSKKNFELTLNNKKNKIKKIDEKSNLTSIFDDIDVFSSNEINANTSRLSASTIEQLFKDTNYNLKKVKKQN